MAGRRRLSEDPEIRYLTAVAAAEQAKLDPWELFWVERQPYLQSKGYMLRPRYRPGWIPSWTLPGNEEFEPNSFEDYFGCPLLVGHIDATRISDGLLVRLKTVPTGSSEVKIASLLTSEQLLCDPRNHCVPLLDHLVDPLNSSNTFFIMPWLHMYDRPPFETVGDVVNFVDQMLEGLTFIHEQNVAHRDFDVLNVMMEADALYPSGFHPAAPLTDRTGLVYCPPLARTEGPVRYYYIDFGLSSHFGPDDERLVVGVLGRDRTVPELSRTKKYDPFKLDIYMVGNTLRTAFYNEHSNLGFLLPLIDAMTQVDPIRRPTAAEAEQKWHGIRAGLFHLHKAWRLWERNEPFAANVVFDGANLVIRSARAGMRLLSWLSDFQG